MLLLNNSEKSLNSLIYSKQYKMKDKGFCPRCKKIIIKDLENYLKKYPNEKWVLCPYCKNHFLTKEIIKEKKKEINDSHKKLKGGQKK